MTDEHNAAMPLLPVPKEIHPQVGSHPRVGLHPRPGFCLIGSDSPVGVQVDDGRVERAVARWLSTLGRSTEPSQRGRVLVGVDTAQTPHRQGYRLTIKPDTIEIRGGSPQGCFHGLQTLAQLARSHQAGIPCGVIVDWPDFDTRGLLHDVTRGKVPTLATFKTLVDRLALLKVNQLQLNIEHAFVFSFDPQICRPDEGLTPEEVRELDAYCRERFIDLVPALATFGHMGRVLSMPKYRHLAETEAVKPWSDMNWHERMRGLTLDCMNPDAWRLVERMWSEVLDAFASPVVNICGDEPWDLGEGRNKKRFSARTKGEAYLDHIRRTHELCGARGRRTQFWSDVVRNYPELFDRVPRNATVLHWGYDDNADYAGTARFTDAGLSTFVCPGTTGWKRIINAMDLAERNISTFAAAGKRHGASGLINTDWGDHGHFNLLSCSWHGIASGAALGWDAHHAIGEKFDAAFARVVLGIEDASVPANLRLASAHAERCETWRLLWMPIHESRDDPTWPGSEQIERAGAAARDASNALRQLGAAAHPTHLDLRELGVACEFSNLFVDKVGLLREREAASDRNNAQGNREAWADRVKPAAARYAECWMARNKEPGLRDVLDALRAAADDVRQLEHRAS